MLGQHHPTLLHTTCWPRLNTVLHGGGSISFKLFIQHLAKNKKSVIVSLEICMKTFEMANSVDECANESFSQEPIVLEMPRKRTTMKLQKMRINHPTLLGDFASV